MKWINVKIDGYDTQYIISENGIVINLNSGNAKYGTLIGEIKIGEDSASAKITEKQAREICRMISEGYRIYEIVNKLGVSRHIVRHIKEGNTWTHISCEYDFTNFNNGILKPSDIDVIIDLIQKNKTYKEINELTGFGTNTIYRIKKNYCGTRPKNTLKSKHRIDAMILKMYFEGTSIDNISELTGYTSSYILDVINHFES